MNESSVNEQTIPAQKEVQPESTPEVKGGLQTEKQNPPENTPELVWPEDVSFSQEAQKKFAALMEQTHLSVEQAQKLIDFEACFARAAAAENKKEQDAWAQETQNFFGPHWQEEVSLAVRAADIFGGPELRTLLEETGLGNHPVIVRTFNEIGKRISEDVSAGGKKSVCADKTFAEAMYGN